MVVDFFLAAFTFKGLFLVFVARLFLFTSPMPFFFKLPKVVDFFDKGDIFLVLFLARFFLFTSPMPFFFKLPK